MPVDPPIDQRLSCLHPHSTPSRQSPPTLEGAVGYTKNEARRLVKTGLALSGLRLLTRRPQTHANSRDRRRERGVVGRSSCFFSRLRATCRRRLMVPIGVSK